MIFVIVFAESLMDHRVRDLGTILQVKTNLPTSHYHLWDPSGYHISYRWLIFYHLMWISMVLLFAYFSVREPGCIPGLDGINHRNYFVGHTDQKPTVSPRRWLADSSFIYLYSMMMSLRTKRSPNSSQCLSVPLERPLGGGSHRRHRAPPPWPS